MSTITLRTKSPGLIIIWTWVGEGPAKTFDAVNNVIAASKNGGYALILGLKGTPATEEENWDIWSLRATVSLLLGHKHRLLAIPLK